VRRTWIVKHSARIAACEARQAAALSEETWSQKPGVVRARLTAACWCGHTKAVHYTGGHEACSVHSCGCLRFGIPPAGSVI
jgi:hypothetical protein